MFSKAFFLRVVKSPDCVKKGNDDLFQTVFEFTKEEHMWCMDDLFPIFQFVVIRSRIHHLGAEIMFIEELMESHLEYGELGIMFTTLKVIHNSVVNNRILGLSELKAFADNVIHRTQQIKLVFEKVWKHC